MTEYCKDLPTYLQYCKDVVFAGLEPSFENHEEEKLIEEFWDFYQNEKVIYCFTWSLFFLSPKGVPVIYKSLNYFLAPY